MKKLTFLSLSIMLVCCAKVETVKNHILPGHVSNSLDDLNPKFRKKVDKLILKIEKRGHTVEVADTFRSADRQNFIYTVGKKLSSVTGVNLKVTGTKKSRHSITKNGKPAACAVDLRPAGFKTIAQQAEFYKDVRDESVKLGLRSGANFEKRRSSPFYKYDLGYDPGHISMKCKYN